MMGDHLETIIFFSVLPILLISLTGLYKTPIAFNFETHNKNLKCEKLIRSINFYFDLFPVSLTSTFWLYT